KQPPEVAEIARRLLLGELLHHTLCLLELLDELVHFLHAGAAACRDAPAAAGVQEARFFPLRRCHGVHYSLKRLELSIDLVLRQRVGDLPQPGKLQDLRERPELLHLLELLAEVLQREAGIEQLALHLLRLSFLDVKRLRPLDQRQDVTHAQDTARQPVGVELLQPVQLFAHTQELDRHAGDFTHRDGRAATSIAVHLGEDQPGQADRIVEALRDVDSFLAGHRVRDEQDLLRLDPLLDRLQLVHHGLVDLEAASRVHDDDAVILAAGKLHAVVGDRRRRGVGPLAVHGDVKLLAERDELFDGGGPVRVRRDEQRPVAFPAQVQRQLASSGRLTGALQTDEHDDVRGVARQVQTARLAERADQLFVHDLHDLLARREALLHLNADRTLAHPLDKGLDHAVVDIRLQQRHADLPHRSVDVVLRQLAVLAQVAEDTLQSIAKALEYRHDLPLCS